MYAAAVVGSALFSAFEVCRQRGAFELAYQSPSDPIWSDTFGFPVPHHYIIGAILAYIGYILITFTKSVRED